MRNRRQQLFGQDPVVALALEDISFAGIVTDKSLQNIFLHGADDDRITGNVDAETEQIVLVAVNVKSRQLGDLVPFKFPCTAVELPFKYIGFANKGMCADATWIEDGLAVCSHHGQITINGDTGPKSGRPKKIGAKQNRCLNPIAVPIPLENIGLAAVGIGLACGTFSSNDGKITRYRNGGTKVVAKSR